MVKLRSYVFVIMIVIFCSGFCLAAFDRVEFGARGLGMGGANTAVSEGVSAVGYNPAGLGSMGNMELLLMNNDLYGIGISNNSMGVAMKSRLGNFALSKLTINDNLYDYREDALSISYGLRLREGFQIGFNMHTYSGESDLNSNGMSFDVGSLINWNKITLGIVCFDLGKKIKYGDAFTESYQPSYRVGVSYNIQDLLFTFDYESKNTFLGIERKFGENLALRCGLRNGDVTLGCSLGMGRLFFDYAFTAYDLNYDHNLTARLSLF